MGREQSLPIFIGNDFEVAQDDICTKTWILLHYISWADTPVCPYIRTSCHTERSEISLFRIVLRSIDFSPYGRRPSVHIRY